MSNLRNLVDPKTKVITSPSVPGSSKKYLLSPSSSDNESAWTSASVPSSIHLVFPAPVSHATHFAITFQGGFSAGSIMVYVATKPKARSSQVDLGLMMARRVYPVDKSSRQVFEIPYPSNTLISPDTAPLPISENTLSTEDLRIETERPANPNGSSSPAPLHPAARNRLPATYQSLTSALDVSSGADGVQQDSINRSGSNESDVVKDRLSQGWTVPDLMEIKLEFEKSSDNQGRVTVYSVELLG